jgi:lipocalin
MESFINKFNINKFTGIWYNIGSNINNNFININDKNIVAEYKLINNNYIRVINKSSNNTIRGLLSLKDISYKYNIFEILNNNSDCNDFFILNPIITLKLKFDNINNIYNYNILYVGFHNDNNIMINNNYANNNNYDYAIIVDNFDNIFILYRKKIYSKKLINKVLYILKLYNFNTNNIFFI